jgi:hypothetical protein
MLALPAVSLPLREHPSWLSVPLRRKGLFLVSGVLASPMSGNASGRSLGGSEFLADLSVGKQSKQPSPADDVSDQGRHNDPTERVGNADLS